MTTREGETMKPNRTPTAGESDMGYLIGILEREDRKARKAAMLKRTREIEESKGAEASLCGRVK